MRIALLIPGGVDESCEVRVIPALLWLIERLSRVHDVHVFALEQYPDARDYQVLGANVHNIGSDGRIVVWRSVRRILALRSALIRNGPFHLVHAFWASSGALARLALVGIARIPLIVTLAGGELVNLPAIAYGAQRTLKSRFLIRLALQRAFRVTAATKFMVDMATAHGARAELIPLGAARNVFDSAGVVMNRDLRPPFRLLAVGSLNRVKNYPMMLRAFRRVLDAEPGTRLDIVGEDTLSGAVQRFASEIGVADKVMFRGFLKTSDLPPLYQSAHLLVHSSWHEAGPVVALEAGMARLPCVGTAVGYMADWLSGTSLAVVPDDDAALAAAILRVLRTPKLHSDLADRAYAFANKFDADYTANAFMAMYRDLLSQAAPHV